MTTPAYSQRIAPPHYVQTDLPAMAPRALPLDERCSLREGGHTFDPRTVRCVYCAASLGGLVARARAMQGGQHVA